MATKNKWDKFPKHFSIINEKELVSTETFQELIKIYKDFNVHEMHVKHMYYGEKGKILEFVLDSFGALKTIVVWRLGNAGGSAYWDPSIVKLINRPKKKRKLKPLTAPKIKKKKQTVISKGCDAHQKYAGARSPRTECKTCWSLYYTKHPDKK